MTRTLQLGYAWRIGIAFGFTSLVILAGMIWMTLQILRLEEMQQEANDRALFEENTRLALWRIDSSLAPMVAQESVRQLTAQSKSPFVTFSFKYGPDGQFTLLGSEIAKDQTVAIERLMKSIPRDRLLSQLPKSTLESNNLFRNSQQLTENRNRSQQEFAQRQENVFSNNALVQQSQVTGSTIPLTPIGIGKDMLLARRASNDEVSIEGCWLDWASLQDAMSELVRDLLPNARLEVCQEGPIEDGSNLLASLPARLEPGSIPKNGPSSNSTMRIFLILTWLGTLGAIVASAMFVYGSIQLAERRAAFVTAVTHELRTPLTTFLMYTEMLSQGMVEQKSQQKYVESLRHEALRLEHLVENVLAYAKLEKKRKTKTVTKVSITELIDRVIPYLEQRASMSSMEFIGPKPLDFDFQVQAIPSLFEQILLNLVDNACKYAANSAVRQIRLSIEVFDRSVAIGVRDFGPGFPPKAKWFQPFHKTAQEAANSVPGVGLGLSLCKRLAEVMNGALEIDSSDQGSCVQLLLQRG